MSATLLLGLAGMVALGVAVSPGGAGAQEITVCFNNTGAMRKVASAMGASRVRLSTLQPLEKLKLPPESGAGSPVA